MFCHLSEVKSRICRRLASPGIMHMKFWDPTLDYFPNARDATSVTGLQCRSSRKLSRGVTQQPRTVRLSPIEDRAECIIDAVCRSIRHIFSWRDMKQYCIVIRYKGRLMNATILRRVAGPTGQRTPNASHFLIGVDAWGHTPSLMQPQVFFYMRHGHA